MAGAVNENVADVAAETNWNKLLKSENKTKKKKQYGDQAAKSRNRKSPIWPAGGHFENDVSLKIKRLVHRYRDHWSLEFMFKAKLKWRVRKQKKSNAAVRRPFSNWRRWKTIAYYPYTHVLCNWSWELKLKAKLTLESGKQNVQYSHQAAILKVKSLKINTLLPVVTINMHMKFEIENEIPKQTWFTFWKPCCLQADRRTDGQGESSTPPPP